MVAAARPLARTLPRRASCPSEDVFTEVQRLVRNLISMNEILRDREHASIRLVMNPDRMVIKEAQRTFTYLNLYGYLTDAVVVNRVFPEELAERLLRRVAGAPAASASPTCTTGFAPVPMLTAPYLAEEVIGPAMLDRLGDGAVRRRRPGRGDAHRARP